MGNIHRRYDASSSTAGDEVFAVNGEVEIQDGGELNVESGGVANIESGGTLKYNGIATRPVVVKLSYDFDTDGGAIGTIDLGGALPAGAIILDGMMNVTEEITSDGAATIALHAASADDILAAAVLGTNGGAGLHDIVPVGTAATAILLTEETDLTLTVAEAALTAGAFDLYLRVLM